MSISPEELNARLRPVPADGFDDPPESVPAAESAPIDYFSDLPAAPTEPATLERLSELAQESRDLDGEIAKATEALAELQMRQDKILNVTIPDIMERLGFESFKLKDGSVLEVKSDVKCAITAENKPEAMAWLREHGYDGIIKTKVQAEFGKGEADKAEAALKALEEAGYSAVMDEAVHPATLKSFVKERLEEGENIPVDTFSIFERKVTKIKLPRKRR